MAESSQPPTKQRLTTKPLPPPPIPFTLSPPPSSQANSNPQRSSRFPSKSHSLDVLVGSNSNLKHTPKRPSPLNPHSQDLKTPSSSYHPFAFTSHSGPPTQMVDWRLAMETSFKSTSSPPATPRQIRTVDRSAPLPPPTAPLPPLPFQDTRHEKLSDSDHVIMSFPNWDATDKEVQKVQEPVDLPRDSTLEYVPQSASYSVDYEEEGESSAFVDGSTYESSDLQSMDSRRLSTAPETFSKDAITNPFALAANRFRSASTSRGVRLGRSLHSRSSSSVESSDSGVKTSRGQVMLRLEEDAEKGFMQNNVDTMNGWLNMALEKALNLSEPGGEESDKAISSPRPFSINFNRGRSSSLLASISSWGRGRNSFLAESDTLVEGRERDDREAVRVHLMKAFRASLDTSISSGTSSDVQDWTVFLNGFDDGSQEMTQDDLREVLDLFAAPPPLTEEREDLSGVVSLVPPTRGTQQSTKATLISTVKQVQTKFKQTPTASGSERSFSPPLRKLRGAISENNLRRKWTNSASDDRSRRDSETFTFIEASELDQEEVIRSRWSIDTTDPSEARKGPGRGGEGLRKVLFGPFN